MAISYKNRLIEFNRLKHALLVDKTGGCAVADRYFCQDDYESIKKMPAEIAHVIWDQLCDNILWNGEWGISQETCTFCIYRKIIGARCTSCIWGTHHGLCAKDSGDFKKLQKYMKKKAIETITHSEYINMIERIRKAIK